ncbi:MAG: phosphopantetheinyl transferase, partial [Pirellulales bacterium]|nr:phosphopantetheinyl transferase [Pirellulales bacterium]
MPLTSDSTIQLWHATSSSGDPGPIEICCERWLDAQERQRADRFKVLTSRNQHVVGRGMAKRLLGKDSVAPQAVHFAFHD